MSKYPVNNFTKQLLWDLKKYFWHPAGVGDNNDGCCGGGGVVVDGDVKSCQSVSMIILM